MFLIMTASCALADIESPKYKVLEKQGDFEIRQYEPYFVASTTYDRSKGETQRDAFMRLFEYISGKNAARSKIKMTAPVTDSIKIPMTAPVTDAPSNGLRKMEFMMPSILTKRQIPVPRDERVVIEKIPARLIATHQFSWFADKEKKQEKANELEVWIERQGLYNITKEAFYAGYDAPYVLPFLKRHEMLIVVEKK